MTPASPRRRAPLAAVLTLALLAAAGPSTAAPPPEAPPPPKGYVCYRARTRVQIDGKLDDPAWADAPWTDDFVDIEGPVREKPRFRTRVKMLWDDRYFYVAAQLDEPHVWGTLTRHDAVIFHDNDFEVFIDPDGDHHGYYEFEINALNTGWDLLLEKPYRDSGTARNEWEIPGLKTATHVDGTLNDPSDQDRGWTVELAFPWSALADRANRPSPPRPGDQWRVNFSRVEWQVTVEGKTYRKFVGRKEDNWVWSPQGVVDMHRPERWGFVQFSDKAPGTEGYRPDPAQPVRDRLVAIYQAQRAYREAHKQWADDLTALELPPYQPGPGETAAVLRPSGPDRYSASITVDRPGGPGRETWTIREDSRLTHRRGD